MGICSESHETGHCTLCMTITSSGHGHLHFTIMMYHVSRITFHVSR